MLYIYIGFMEREKKLSELDLVLYQMDKFKKLMSV